MDGKAAKLAVHTYIRQFRETRERVMYLVQVLCKGLEEWRKYRRECKMALVRLKAMAVSEYNEKHVLRERLCSLSSKKGVDRATSPVRMGVAPGVVRAVEKKEDVEASRDARTEAL